MSDLISRKETEMMLRAYADDVGCNRGEYELANGILKAVCYLDNIPTAFDLESVIERLQTELSLADKEKERCARENPLQFDEAKGYSSGVAVALEILKSAANATNGKNGG